MHASQFTSSPTFATFLNLVPARGNKKEVKNILMAIIRD